MRRVLGLAAAYNLLLVGAAVLFPGAVFALPGMPAFNYPFVWQCIGMIVAVYGIAYAAASTDPIRYWPVVLAGLGGKVLGTIGFLIAAVRGDLAWSLGWTILANDVVWWMPFTLILREAYRQFLREPVGIQDPRELARLLDGMKTQHGASLAELSALSPVMVVFLRHAGCTFCREALADIAQARKAIEAEGTRIVLVHMSDESNAERFFDRYGLQDVERISDPERRLYSVFGLRRGALRQLFGWNVWLRGFEAGILRRHGAGLLQGDGFQMPGIFLLADGELHRSFRHRTAADRPDYEAIAGCLPANQKRPTR
jgi:peroxiredoxin